VVRRPRRRNPWRRRPAANAASGPLAAAGAGAAPRTSSSYTRELAGRRQCEYVWHTDELQHPSQILLDESDATHRLGELYRVMRRDDTALAGLIEKRVNAVLGLPRAIQATEASDRGAQTALFCRDALRRVPKLHINLANQLLGKLDGSAYDEIVFDASFPEVAGVAAAWVPRDILDRPMWRFGWKASDAGDYGLYVRTREGGLTPAPVGKFLVNTCGTKDSPYGRPLMDQVYWMYWLKLRAFKFWGISVEKFAQPSLVGKYPRATTGTDRQTEDQLRQDEVIAAIEDWRAEIGVAVPSDVEFLLLEAKNNAGLTYDHFISMCDRAMSLAITGEVDTSGLGKGPGSYAKSRVSNEVRFETLAADAHELETHLTDNLLALLVGLNFGPGWPVPRFSIDVQDATDREQRQRGLERFAKFGLPVLKSELYRVHQVTEPEEGDETVVPYADATAITPAAAADGAAA